MGDLLKRHSKCLRWCLHFDDFRRFFFFRRFLSTSLAGIAADFINVGPDPDLEARIARQAGISGADEEWPVAFWNGDCVGGLEDLARFVEQTPPEPLPPLPGELSGEAGAGDDDLAFLSPEGRRQRQQFAEQLRNARAPPPAEEPLEASMNVLDMRLSVLGTQFREHTVYPDLDASLDGGAEHGGNSNSNNSEEKAANANNNNSNNNNNNNNDAKGEGQSPLRTVDLALEGLEWAVLKGATWLQGFVVAPAPAGAEEEGRRHPDFEVVQSNWYGRQQKRLLRVTDAELQRVHPMTGEVRHAVPFGSLVALGVSKNGQTLQVMCRGDTEREVVTDTYQTVYSKQIIDSIRKRHPKLQVVIIAPVL